MLFNSLEFIFGFVPFVALCVFILSNKLKNLDYVLISLACLSFYFMGQSSFKNLLIFIFSILINYSLSKIISNEENSSSKKKIALYMGILFNLFFLGYFKYTNFLLDVIGDLGGPIYSISKIALPLGISFYTFQQMAFLVDTYNKLVVEITPRKYLFFITFFPQLVAGPIVHYKEIGPQIDNSNLKIKKENISVGISIFVIGLFKKIVFADGISHFVHPVFNAIADGQEISFFVAWGGLLSFAIQVYFDFSGYSDMAIGISRILGIKLPVNFYSPYKAVNIADFWRRWHITLTRFLTTYIYNPLVLNTNRKNPKVKFNKKFSTYFKLITFPTVITMVLSGVWHGAGNQFVLFGILHGAYVLIFHCWTYLTKKTFINRWKGTLSYRFLSHKFNLFFILMSWIYFRSVDISSGNRMLRGCLGLNGYELPVNWKERFSGLSSHFNFSYSELGGLFQGKEVVWIFCLGIIIFFAPSTQEIMGDYEPTVDYKLKTKTKIRWSSTPVWGGVIGILFAVTLFKINEVSDFLYWHF